MTYMFPSSLSSFGVPHEQCAPRVVLLRCPSWTKLESAVDVYNESIGRNPGSGIYGTAFGALDSLWDDPIHRFQRRHEVRHAFQHCARTHLILLHQIPVCVTAPAMLQAITERKLQRFQSELEQSESHVPSAAPRACCVHYSLIRRPSPFK